MSKRILVVLFIVVSVLATFFFIQPTEVDALIVTNSTITLGCTSYDYEFDYEFDRDNTGTGYEAYYIEITDGAGKVLRWHENSFLVGTTGHDGPGTITYSALPDYNPLTYRFVSIAGNGFDQQLVELVTGFCAGLPMYPAQPQPQIGMISISALQAQPVYESAGGNVVRDAGGNELWLPQDYDGNGFDTFVVMSSTDIDGRVWYEIWIGQAGSTVWLPADNVGFVE